MPEEQKLKLSIANKGHTGYKHTEEAKTKIGLVSVERGRKNKLKKLQVFDESQKEMES